MATTTVFKNKLAAWNHLIESGWQIGKSQFYDHCKEGFLRPIRSGENKGKYALSAVEKYAKLNVRQTETGLKVDEKFEAHQEEMREIGLEKARTKLEAEKHDLGVKQSKYILRSDFELEIVARAVAFMAHLNHTVQEGAPDWIEIVGGDQQRTAEMVDAISRAIEQRMSDFATNTEFDIILEAN